MYKHVWLLCIFLVCTLVTFGNGISDAINELQDRTLIIVTETPLQKTLSKFTPEDKLAYAKAVENYNRKLSEVSSRFWKFNKSVEFKTWDEVDALVKVKADNYLLFYAGNYSSTNVNEGMIGKGLLYYPNIYADGDKRDYKSVYTSYKLCKIEDFKKGDYIIARTITNIWPLKEDIVFAFQYVQCLLVETGKANVAMDAAAVANNSRIDFTRTTLLLKNVLLDGNLTIAERGFKYKIEEHDSLLNEILTPNDVAYVEIVPSIVGTGEAYRMGYEHVVMSAQTGTVVAYIPVEAAVLHFTAGQGSPQKFISTGAINKYLYKTVPTNPAPRE